MKNPMGAQVGETASYRPPADFRAHVPELAGAEILRHLAVVKDSRSTTSLGLGARAPLRKAAA